MSKRHRHSIHLVGEHGLRLLRGKAAQAVRAVSQGTVLAGGNAATGGSSSTHGNGLQHRPVYTVCHLGTPISPTLPPHAQFATKVKSADEPNFELDRALRNESCGMEYARLPKSRARNGMWLFPSERPYRAYLTQTHHADDGGDRTWQNTSGPMYQHYG
jgi:hypothetical protein